MARNSEKAMTTLARWRAAHVDKVNEKERRPYLATECDDLPKAEKWRRQIIGEISRKVAQIQNAGLGEFKLRDLNDEINKLMREKRHWEDRIVELGGPHYKRTGPKMLDREGKEVPGNRGYKYFGATKDLPGVRELFQQEPPTQARKTRAELMKDIDAEYYGYMDEDDGLLVPLESEAEKKSLQKKISEWGAKKEAMLHGEGVVSTMGEGVGSTPVGSRTGDEEDIYKVHEESDDEAASVQKMEEDEEPGVPKFIAHVPVPSQKEVEEALIRRKKMELLQKYASDHLRTDTEETKSLLGITE